MLPTVDISRYNHLQRLVPVHMLPKATIDLVESSPLQSTKKSKKGRSDTPDGEHRALPSLKNDPHGFVVSLFPEASKDVKAMEEKLATMEKKLKEMKEKESPKQRTPFSASSGDFVYSTGGKGKREKTIDMDKLNDTVSNLFAEFEMEEERPAGW